MNLRFASGLVCAAAFAPVIFAETVPVPTATAIPITASSRPLMGADHTMEPVDLAKSGYVETEFLLSGKANVYNWGADGSLTVKTPNAPYTGRILVRRPTNPAKFSGTIVVEIMNNARRFDWAMMWGYMHEHLMDHGDAWVGISMPPTVAGLQKFDAKRYAALSFANPNPTELCPTASAARGGPPGPPAASATEDGLRWDMISQVAAALKSTDKSMPFAGFRVDRIYMTSQITDLDTYINAIHSHANLADGKSAYDGYLIRNPVAPTKISNCGAPPPAGDPRNVVKDVNVPIIAVVAQGEVAASVPFRKPDSDSPSGRYRVYEIAGAAHVDKFAYATGFPAIADQTAAIGSAQGTSDWPFNAMCQPPIPLSDLPLLKYSYDSALVNLDAWSRKGTAPPKAERMQEMAVQQQIGLASTSAATLILDEFGHAKGGVRSPFVDVPVATYTTTTPGPGTCAELGHAIPFPAERIKMLYTTPQDYAKRVSLDVDALVKARWFTESDGKKMKDSLIAAFGK